MVDERLKQHLQMLVEKVIAESDNTDDEFTAQITEGAMLDAIDFMAKKLDSILEWKDRSSSDDGMLSAASIEEMAILATEFDNSGDPLLMKQAAVLDEILLTIGTNAARVAAAKHAVSESEIERIREKAKKQEKDPYTIVKTEHDKQNGVDEARKAMENRIKEYRPLEAPLSTRTCPDHPGAQISRIAENTYQCSLDKGIYNFESGYTTMKGNKVPGSDVSNQTQALQDRPNEFTSFDSRESKLNQT